MLLETQPLTNDTTLQRSVPAIESVPPMIRRNMHPAEPVQWAKPLTMRWWTAGIVDAITSTYRLIVRSLTSLNASEHQS